MNTVQKLINTEYLVGFKWRNTAKGLLKIFSRLNLYILLTLYNGQCPPEQKTAEKYYFRWSVPRRWGEKIVKDRDIWKAQTIIPN